MAQDFRRRHPRLSLLEQRPQELRGWYNLCSAEGVGPGCSELATKETRTNIPLVRSWPVPGFRLEWSRQSGWGGALGERSCQACCSVKTRRRQTRITKIPSALGEARARFPSHGIQCVTVTLPSSWTVALAHCWDASRLPWEHAGALPVKTKTPQSCCKTNSRDRAKGPAALFRQPTANRERGLEGTWAWPAAGEKCPFVPEEALLAPWSINHFRAARRDGVRGCAERRALGSRRLVSHPAPAPTNHPAVKRAP